MKKQFFYTLFKEAAKMLIASLLGGIGICVIIYIYKFHTSELERLLGVFYVIGMMPLYDSIKRVFGLQ